MKDDPTILPSVAKQHILVAWFAGGMMAWLAESYRRRTFAGQALARLAHTKELHEKSRHLRAQEQLAAAREEVRLFLSARAGAVHESGARSRPGQKQGKRHVELQH